MSIKTEMPRHLEDHELVGMMDRIGTDADRTDWEIHLADCIPCAERLEEIRTGSNWLHQNIGLLDQDVQVDELARARALAAARRAAKRQTRTPSWTALGRAAAVAGLIGAIGFTPNPVRAWFLEWSGLGVEEVAETVAPVADDARGAMVSFAPTERVFTIELDEPQIAGSVQIIVTDDEAATAQLLNGAEESFSVLPAALLISNSEASSASYEVNLPREMVQTVNVVVAGEPIARVSVTADMEPVVVDLALQGAP